jgi:hypothetical protein
MTKQLWAKPAQPNPSASDAKRIPAQNQNNLLPL